MYTENQKRIASKMGVFITYYVDDNCPDPNALYIEKFYDLKDVTHVLEVTLVYLVGDEVLDYKAVKKKFYAEHGIILKNISDSDWRSYLFDLNYALPEAEL